MIQATRAWLIRPKFQLPLKIHPSFNSKILSPQRSHFNHLHQIKTKKWNSIGTLSFRIEQFKDWRRPMIILIIGFYRKLRGAQNCHRNHLRSHKVITVNLLSLLKVTTYSKTNLHQWETTFLRNHDLVIRYHRYLIRKWRLNNFKAFVIKL